MKCVSKYETATDMGTGGAALTFTINPHSDIKSRTMDGTPSLVGVYIRFIATAGDGDSTQSTDTIITVSRARTDESDVTGTAFTNRGDWNTQLDIDDRSAAGTAYDYSFIPNSPIRWSEDESLQIKLA
ncbi:MAG: hypothetical protein GY851_20925, partial [bacterium]|nr:hypothetical protein [bacterium]